MATFCHLVTINGMVFIVTSTQHLNLFLLLNYTIKDKEGLGEFCFLPGFLYLLCLKRSMLWVSLSWTLLGSSLSRSVPSVVFPVVWLYQYLM